MFFLLQNLFINLIKGNLQIKSMRRYVVLKKKYQLNLVSLFSLLNYFISGPTMQKVSWLTSNPGYSKIRTFGLGQLRNALFRGLAKNTPSSKSLTFFENYNERHTLIGNTYSSLLVKMYCMREIFDEQLKNLGINLKKIQTLHIIWRNWHQGTLKSLVLIC